MKTAVAILVLLVASTAYAFRPIWNQRNPLFELTADQLIALNVSNLGNETAQKVKVSFFDDQGRTLASSTRMLAPGESTRMELAPGARRVRPQIEVLGIGL